MQIEMRKNVLFNYCDQKLVEIEEFKKAHNTIDALLFKSTDLDKLANIVNIRDRFTTNVNNYLLEVNKIHDRISFLYGMCGIGLPILGVQGNEHIKDKVLLTEDDYILLYKKVELIGILRKLIQSFTFEIESEVKASITGIKEI